MAPWRYSSRGSCRGYALLRGRSRDSPVSPRSSSSLRTCSVPVATCRPWSEWDMRSDVESGDAPDGRRGCGSRRDESVLNGVLDELCVGLDAEQLHHAILVELDGPRA